MANRLEMYQEELSYIIDIIENYFPKNFIHKLLFPCNIFHFVRIRYKRCYTVTKS